MAQKTHLQAFTEELQKLLQIEKEFEKELKMQYLYTDSPRQFHESTFKPHMETGAFVSKRGNLLFYTKFY